MFEKFVLATSGLYQDLDAALQVMDQGLFEAALMQARLDPDGAFTQNEGMSDFAMDVWENYCVLHLNRYGSPFVPDLGDNWDVIEEPKIEEPEVRSGDEADDLEIRILPKGHPKRLGW